MGIQLDIYSHHFVVSGVDALAYQAIEQYARRLVQTHIERDLYGNVTTKAVYVYATRSYIDAHYRFHISLLDEFRNYLQDKLISVSDIVTHPLYTPTSADIQMKQGWQPKENQVPVIEYLVSDGYKKVIDAQTGSGKALCNGTPVKTPSGWTNIEDLKVGDLVMGELGEYHKVTGVFPQGKKDLYVFTFKDGRTAVADAEHLWGVVHQSRYQVMSTSQLVNSNEGNLQKFSIPLVKHGSGMYSYKIFKEWLADTTFIDGHFVYTTKNEEEALALQQLCWSYGSVCSVKLSHGIYTVYTGFHFHLNKCMSINSHLPIVKIQKLDQQAECTCISIDNPTQLYVIKDYIVTHNTIMTLFALSDIKQRVGVVIKPMYIERWLDAIYGSDAALANVTIKDVMVVKGSKHLRGLFYLAQEGKLNVKFIIISNRTLAQYYQYYKEHGQDDFYANVKPEDMWELLGVGVRLIDEAHEEFFSCFQCDLHTNVPKSIELSGTLNPDDQFLRRMYEVMYPTQLRMNAGVYVRYIDLVGLTYGLREDPKPVKTTRRGKNYYSQAAYEESLYKQQDRMDRLKKMIAEEVEELFIVRRLDEHKLLMFFETVDMCTVIAELLTELYPKLKVTRYTQEESADVLQTHDIIVATPKSAGTAVDIPRLQVVISFVMRSSNQSLQQMVGRLRQLKTDIIQPTYYYMFTRSIPAHNGYSKKIEEVFKFKALSHSIRRINYEL